MTDALFFISVGMVLVSAGFSWGGLYHQSHQLMLVAIWGMLTYGVLKK